MSLMHFSSVLRISRRVSLQLNLGIIDENDSKSLDPLRAKKDSYEGKL